MSKSYPSVVKPYMVDAEGDGNAEDSFGVDQIPIRPGRELIEVSRRGARCYRLEKIKCGKKGCRCGRGELHGPYWYAYYRENGRMRCEYIGKSMPEHQSLENRARKACRSSKVIREKAARTVAQVKETLKRVKSFESARLPDRPQEI